MILCILIFLYGITKKIRIAIYVYKKKSYDFIQERNTADFDISLSKTPSITIFIIIITQFLVTPLNKFFKIVITLELIKVLIIVLLYVYIIERGKLEQSNPNKRFSRQCFKNALLPLRECLKKICVRLCWNRYSDVEALGKRFFRGA